MSQIASKAFYESELNDWVNKEKSAISLISSIGNLLYEKSIELVLFRNPLVDQSVSEILSLHQSTGEVTGNKITVEDSSALAKELVNINIAPSKIDIGKLASEWSNEKNNFSSITEFLNSKLGAFKIEDNQSFEPRDVVLYGFGRIGRLAARELIKQAGKGQQLRLRAIIVRNNSKDQIKKRASLLRMDSVHGPFPGTIIEDYENKTLNINGQLINIIQASHPSEIDYTQYGINDALVIDNTGVFTDKEALSNHLKSKGVKKVLLTAPGKEIPNIVYGINQKEFDVADYDIFSAASCTTNAISPILKVIEDNYGVEKGHIETVHAYTNDQNLLDNYHKKPRRGRSAAVNMVITSTGAGKAVTKVIPSLAGKLTANAVRVPTPNGSLAIMNLSVNKEVNLEDVNSMVKKYAMEGDLVNQIKFSIEEELVSNDIIGNSCCSVFDSYATIVSEDKKNVVLYVWYDNEFGYTKQVIRLAKHVAGVRRLLYY
ncbi:MAG: glyceraldehyde 3-phosphate dehydrogenase [Urechidicola sp.]|jgi:glyceraldehyde 3-phosphate dehydrogenase|tara:strand:+ start:16596 stop:18056 length:1461 start_codon:yes stop_codon:yes gene_type:complete